MEKPELEKVIERLEGVDIREWEFYNNNIITAETGGLKFYLENGGWKNLVDGDRIYYELRVERTGRGGSIEYHYDKKDKTMRDKLENFYEKTYSALKEDQKIGLIKMLNEFVLELKKMENPESEKELETFIKKLENIDIREWKYHQGLLIAEKYGLEFTLGESWLHIENLPKNNYYVRFNKDNIKNKTLRSMLKQFYDKTLTQLEEYQKKELEEKIEAALSE